MLRGRTNAEAGATYVSNLTSTLTADKITVSIDGDSSASSEITKEIVKTEAKANATTGANDVEVTLKLSNIAQATRKSGKKYKEWSTSHLRSINVNIWTNHATTRFWNRSYHSYFYYCFIIC